MFFLSANEPTDPDIVETCQILHLAKEDKKEEIRHYMTQQRGKRNFEGKWPASAKVFKDTEWLEEWRETVNLLTLMKAVTSTVSEVKSNLFGRTSKSVLSLKYRGKVKDNGKVAVYDYKTRRADVIPHPARETPANLEVVKDPFGVQNFLAGLSSDEQKTSAVVCAGNSGLPGGAIGLSINVKGEIRSPKTCSKLQCQTMAHTGHKKKTW